MDFDIKFVFKLIFFVLARYPQGEDPVVTSPQSSTFLTKSRSRLFVDYACIDLPFHFKDL
jgi:hypothetical protein